MEKILIIDDDLDILKLQKKILTSQGYEVDTAMLPGQALRMLEENQYDVILLDIMMPAIDGYALAKMINATDDWNPPIIFVSAKEDVRDVEKAYESGGVAYISKPFSANMLCKMVEMVLEMYPLWETQFSRQFI